jgi:hypothetical protein
VSRDILGADFAGTLVTDCSTVYGRHAARFKQKCLAHVRRTARDGKTLVRDGKHPQARQFFDDVIAWVQRGCRYHRERKRGELSPAQDRAEKKWLRAELKRLEVAGPDVAFPRRYALRGTGRGRLRVRRAAEAQTLRSLPGAGHPPALFPLTTCGPLVLFQGPLCCAVRSSSSHDPDAVAACRLTASGRLGPRCARPAALPAADRCEEGRVHVCRERTGIAGSRRWPMMGGPFICPT